MPDPARSCASVSPRSGETSGYTRSMSSRTKQLASVVTVVVLSGAPAMLSACAALCLPGIVHAAAGQEDQALSAVEAVDHVAASSHAHHAASVAPAKDHATADHRSALGMAVADSKIAGTDHACCPDARAIGLRSVASPRVDTAAPLVSTVASVPLLQARRSVPVAHAADTTGARRSPARTALVLRI